MKKPQPPQFPPILEKVSHVCGIDPVPGDTTSEIFFPLQEQNPDSSKDGKYLFIKFTEPMPNIESAEVRVYSRCRDREAMAQFFKEKKEYEARLKEWEDLQEIPDRAKLESILPSEAPETVLLVFSSNGKQFACSVGKQFAGAFLDKLGQEMYVEGLDLIDTTEAPSLA